MKSTKNYECFELVVPTPGEYTFSISQKAKKMYPKNSGYKYSSCRLFLVKTDTGGKSLHYIKGALGLAKRDTFLQIENLEEGEYLLYCEIDWAAKISPDMV